MHEFNKNIQKKFEEISRAMEALTVSLKKVQTVLKAEKWEKWVIGLADYGWYLPIDDTTPNELIFLGKTFERGDIDFVDKFLSDFVGDNLERIKKKLIERFPSRARIFEQAFGAHQDEKYYITVPVFLAQADGIFAQEKGALFGTNNSKPKSFKWTENLTPESVDWILAAPLRNTVGFNRSNRDKTKKIYSRHDIVHGIQYDYGTKLYSLKAISLLNYLSDFVLFRNDR